MQASIQPVFTWSRERIFAGEKHQVTLLVEWMGIAQNEVFRKKSRRVVARDIELKIWFEAHASYQGCYGCTAEEEDGGGSLALQLGKIHAGQRKAVALDLALQPMPAGSHTALWVQWQYKQPPVERIKELPLAKLGIEYTRHTDTLRTSGSSYVEKHRELLKATKTIEEAQVQGFPGGNDRKVNEKLRRQADQLLLLAARLGDMELVKEAESLYRQLDAQEGQPGLSGNIGRSPFIRRN